MYNSGNEIRQFDLDDFNLNSNETAWEAPARDPRALGNKIISTPEASASPELGQIVNLEMPPRPEQPLNPATNHASSAHLHDLSYDRSGLKTTDKLDKRGVAAVSQVISKFNQTGNAGDFYRAIRGEGGMMETNLKQSYNRTLGEGL